MPLQVINASLTQPCRWTWATNDVLGKAKKKKSPSRCELTRKMTITVFPSCVQLDVHLKWHRKLIVSGDPVNGHKGH